MEYGQGMDKSRMARDGSQGGSPSASQPEEKMDELERLKTRFLSNISHEMRTPINGIIGSVRLLQMMNPDEEQEELLEGIAVSARRMMHLVENVLLHAELTSGRIDMAWERVMPARMMADVAQTHEKNREESRVAMRVETDPAVPDWMVADRESLIRVLDQLLDNAFKHTHQGEVLLRMWMTDEPPDPRCAQANRMMAVSVTDTGIGIEPEVLSGLFASFAKADDSYTSRYQGAGLGLMLCRMLAQRMYARLEVESEPGRGSTFRLLFPVQVEDGVLRSDERADRPRILVMEDDETSRTLMGLFCELVEMEAVLAPDGATGWEWYQRLPFDLLLMDIQMPGMSGLTALQHIRERETETGIHTCAIAVTAYAMADDRNKFLAAGFDDVLEKPVDLNRFRAMLAKWRVGQPKNGG